MSHAETALPRCHSQMSFNNTARESILIRIFHQEQHSIERRTYAHFGASSAESCEAYIHTGQRGLEEKKRDREGGPRGRRNVRKWDDDFGYGHFGVEPTSSRPSVQPTHNLSSIPLPSSRSSPTARLLPVFFPLVSIQVIIIRSILHSPISLRCYTLSSLPPIPARPSPLPIIDPVPQDIHPLQDERFSRRPLITQNAGH